MAVGGSFSATTDVQTLVESSSGGTWSIVPSPSTSADEWNELNGVSCITSTSCAAVGLHTSATPSEIVVPEDTVIETWDGSVWSLTASPTSTARKKMHRALNGVACVGETCTAAGRT